MATRHDPYFYLPRFVRLEALVQTRSQAKLRDFIVAMSGGFTPKAEEQEKYYADATTGVPFVRVQNLKVSGELSLDDVKHVNHETHHGLLVRSQVKQDDLLVKITGVGRMAVAAVPPQGFEGNINQHIARIRTKDRASSEALAAWLNTDIAEALAKRRSTGGTRPALDYPALRSMPVILDERTEREVRAAYNAYKTALKQANQKLAGIDNYLLAELGIALPPEPENTLVSRIFTVQRRELAGFRFDARVHRANFDLVSTRFNSPLLKQIAEINPRTDFRNIEVETLLTFVPMEAITDEDGSINAPQERSFAENVGYTSFQEGDLLWAKITPCMENGKSAVAEKLLNGYGFGSTEYHVFRPKSVELNIKYLHALLRMKRLRFAAMNYFGGSSGHQRVDEAFFVNLHIPLPEPTVQRRIVEEIENRRTDARTLRAEAKTELETAKRRIEAILLGETA
ncbi:MAG TPA: hypothetical protein DEQ20_06170 [Desulfobulbaceae bacterium]|nr:MAG: hypothetical protein A2520_05440 [Deltaproteobacteria bacterium RIFOXYD12_FULL_53_23]HCC54495.1 hypothetical protein [Desulfobulbaceae bacterium]